MDSKLSDDYALLGTDASGLELRMLAHYMNDEAYTKEVVEGDVHTANQNSSRATNQGQRKDIYLCVPVWCWCW